MNMAVRCWLTVSVFLKRCTLLLSWLLNADVFRCVWMDQSQLLAGDVAAGIEPHSGGDCWQSESNGCRLLFVAVFGCCAGCMLFERGRKLSVIVTLRDCQNWGSAGMKTV